MAAFSFVRAPGAIAIEAADADAFVALVERAITHLLGVDALTDLRELAAADEIDLGGAHAAAPAWVGGHSLHTGM
jgi:hypothetical protein